MRQNRLTKNRLILKPLTQHKIILKSKILYAESLANIDKSSTKVFENCPGKSTPIKNLLNFLSRFFYYIKYNVALAMFFIILTFIKCKQH